MKDSKLRLFAVIPLLLLAVLLVPLLKQDKPTVTVTETTPTTTTVITTAALTATAPILTSTEATESVTVPTVTTSAPDTTDEAIHVFAPTDEPSVLVTGLVDTPPIALTEATPTEAPPVIVTGLPDTLPIEVPLRAPTLAADTVAAYIATAYRLDFPQSTVLTAESLTSELEALVQTAKQNGVNTLFFQVRPASDAFYVSEIFPSSRYLVQNEGDTPPIDVLETLITLAHRAGIGVHAWVNPYRVTSSGESVFMLSPDNPALRHPEYTFSLDGAVYYHPALDEVIALIVAGIREIVENYAVDGILFDDYFYPEGITNEDLLHYQTYRAQGGTLSLADWRRENVNRLIQESYRAIKSIDPTCRFGVAPRGIWRNITEDADGSITTGGAAYDSIYCDAVAWVKAGTVDYLAPQLYWSYHEEKAQFVTLALWWHTLLEGTKIELIPSLAAYRLSREEIKAQIFYLAALPDCHGYALYRMDFLS